MNVRLMLLAGAGAGVVAAAEPTAEPRVGGGDAGEAVISESFAAAPVAPWKWVRENPAGWRVGAQGLEVRIEEGNMWGPQNDAKNVLVRPLPRAVAADRDMEITVTVTNDPTHQWEQVDLVYYFDDGHMVKIGQEMVDGTRSIVMGREEKDRTRTIAIIPLEKTTVSLRLVVDAAGTTVRGHYRPEGSAEWREAGECPTPAPAGGVPHASLQFYRGAPDAPHWAKVKDFSVRLVPRE